MPSGRGACAARRTFAARPQGTRPYGEARRPPVPGDTACPPRMVMTAEVRPWVEARQPTCPSWAPPRRLSGAHHAPTPVQAFSAFSAGGGEPPHWLCTPGVRPLPATGSPGSLFLKWQVGAPTRPACPWAVTRRHYDVELGLLP